MVKDIIIGLKEWYWHLRGAAMRGKGPNSWIHAPRARVACALILSKRQRPWMHTAGEGGLHDNHVKMVEALGVRAKS